MKTPGRPFAILEGILPIDTRQVPVDIVAGITLAALAIPEVMGYAKIAGMPVVSGLYTILIPMALYALFGSSRRLVVGADSATAAIMAAGLVGMAAIASPQYVALAGLLAILTGLIVLLARIVRLGFLGRHDRAGSTAITLCWNRALSSSKGGLHTTSKRRFDRLSARTDRSMLLVLAPTETCR